jgi:hypothetical protein
MNSFLNESEFIGNATETTVADNERTVPEEGYYPYSQGVPFLFNWAGRVYRICFSDGICNFLYVSIKSVIFCHLWSVQFPVYIVFFVSRIIRTQQRPEKNLFQVQKSESYESTTNRDVEVEGYVVSNEQYDNKGVSPLNNQQSSSFVFGRAE